MCVDYLLSDILAIGDATTIFDINLTQGLGPCGRLSRAHGFAAYCLIGFAFEIEEEERVLVDPAVSHRNLVQVKGEDHEHNPLYEQNDQDVFQPVVFIIQVAPLHALLTLKFIVQYHSHNPMTKLILANLTRIANLL